MGFFWSSTYFLWMPKMWLKCNNFFPVFQLFYSTLFGAYSAYLFTKTGHLMSSFIAHAFCNYMGFPDFGELLAYQGVKRVFIGTMFVVGLVLWWILLVPLMNSKWYSNDLYMWEVWLYLFLTKTQCSFIILVSIRFFIANLHLIVELILFGCITCYISNKDF